MATDPTQFANVALSDNFNTWRTRTNQIAASLSSNTFTVANTINANGASKAITFGHGLLRGSIGVEELYANVQIGGGERGNVQPLTIISNTNIMGRTFVSNDAIFGLNGEEEVLMNSRLLVGANATFRETVRMDADVHIGNDDSDTLTVNSISRFNSNVHIDGDTISITGNTQIGGANTDTFLVNAVSTFDADVAFRDEVSFSANVIISGDVVLGDTSADDLTFNGSVASSIVPNANGTYDLGSSLLTYGTTYTAFVEATQADISDALNVSGLSALNGVTTKGITANGFTSLLSGAQIYNGLTAYGDIDLGYANTDTLTVNADAVFNGDATFNNRTAFINDVAFTGNEVVIDSNLTIGTDFVLTATEGRYANLEISNTSIFEGNVVFGVAGGNHTTRVSFTSNVGSDILPHSTDTYDLGSTTNRWADIHSGGTLYYTNLSPISGTGEVGLPLVVSNIIPSPTNTYDLGSSSAQWKDLYIDGTGNIDTLITETATIANLTVPSEFMTIDSANVETYTRGRISVTDSGGDGSLSYNSTTGVITYTGPSASEARAHFSGGTSGTGFGDLTYNSGTGAFTYAKVTAANIRGNFSAATSNTETTTFGDFSYNSSTGEYSLQKVGRQEIRGSISVTDNGGDGSLSYSEDSGTITYTGPSAAQVRAHFSAGTGVGISSGQISIGQSVATSDSPTFAGQTINGTASMRSITVPADSTYNIGTSTVKHATIYADTFNGTATQAKYADLAEKYLADQTYATGTVVCVGGTAEVTASTGGMAHAVVGVVSENPAYMMNSDLEGGTYIALKGRVPVKIEGSVNKGAMLAASDEGRAVAFANVGRPFAIALEDGNYDTETETGTDTIEAFIM